MKELDAARKFAFANALHVRVVLQDEGQPSLTLLLCSEAKKIRSPDSKKIGSSQNHEENAQPCVLKASKKCVGRFGGLEILA